MRGRRFSVVLVGLSLALSAAACGDDDEPVTATGAGQSSATTPSTTPATAPATTAAPKPVVATASSGAFGTIFVDSAGKTLYTWDRDTGPTSTCTGNCAATWPPLVLPAGTTEAVGGPGVGPLTATARPDDAAKLQVVWGGKPLYYYAADTAPGDVKGDGVGGTWHVAKPSS
jgi:predicted lipoprotein with Yx(FWY)xxD motif